jgi:hypothetical protein
MAASVTRRNKTISVRAWKGDAKTLLAFDLLDTRNLDRFAGFTIEYTTGAGESHYLHNNLRFENPATHAQVASESPWSMINAPLHYFRWLHVPGSLHQGVAPYYGEYTYTVTPRFTDDTKALLPIDRSLSVTVGVDVEPFAKNGLRIGFTRGYVQSQAFVDNFGKDARPTPEAPTLDFDTSQVAGTNPYGRTYTWRELWEWLGFTARRRVFELLDEVVANPRLSVDVFAYDLDEPDLTARLLTLARDGRIRIILDNSSLHHDKNGTQPEDEFEALFAKRRRKGAELKRGKFDRYSHDKVIVVRRAGKPVRVLTGSTNFSMNGLYVNANHVLVFDDPAIAKTYGEVFDTVWQADVKRAAFASSGLARTTFRFPRTAITFAPHDPETAVANLDEVVARIDDEEQADPPHASVLFAVMGLSKGTGPVLPALNKLHEDERIFTYGISDSPDGIALYAPGKRTGLLVTGKPVRVQLPRPFNQVYRLGTLDHQIHHKFVVCGFRGARAAVWCGSSNLTAGGEEKNGDNLITIRDRDVATVFAVEAAALVDHFNFLDKQSRSGGRRLAAAPPADKREGAELAGWWLSPGGGWARKYFDEHDLKCADRRLFA